ncbi:winged helix-turn-helix domain-containing protein [Foetidibacter luteolus]|uniref:winged helix-turn-helix domain-containing protein n=1 Tax=Foetidibacter luteolus TaxID=2608880 RepID=UPI00129A51A4|nr:winged helix-turn-helix domain-containing protein [Foetidibacter luteolus]
MKPNGIYDIIRIDVFSSTPKYRQIIYAVLKAIESGRLKPDDELPSINDLSYELDVSRDTVERGYRYLKKKGLLNSVPGKGYYIKDAVVKQVPSICLLFNKLSAHKKIIYDSFVEAIGKRATIDFYIYNNDFSLFKNILTSRGDSYMHYVIIPHFIEGGEKAYEIINTLPKDKLLLLDKQVPGVEGKFASVYENFSKDIYCALVSAKDKLSKYNTLKILFPKNSYYPKEIVEGFCRFCQDFAFNYKVVGNIAMEEVRRGEAYISVMEDDLVPLIEVILQRNFEVGEDVGIISYNETPVKKVILNGITTISTDFKKMGKWAAMLILNGSKKHIEVPFMLVMRNSL